MPVKVLLGQVHFIVKGCPNCFVLFLLLLFFFVCFVLCFFLREIGESVSRQVCK